MTFSEKIQALIASTSQKARLSVPSCCLVIALLLWGCGSQDVTIQDHSIILGIPAVYRDSPIFPYVTPGSLDVVFSLRGGVNGQPAVVALMGEAGSSIMFGFVHSTDSNSLAQTLTTDDAVVFSQTYKAPITVVPPAVLVAFSKKNSNTGPIRSLSIDLNDAIAATFAAQKRALRFDVDDFADGALEKTGILKSGLITGQRVDKQNNSNDEIGVTTLDSAGDSPQLYGGAGDLSSVSIKAVGEQSPLGEAFEVSFHTNAPPDTSGKVFYQSTWGKSRISGENFGEGFAPQFSLTVNGGRAFLDVASDEKSQPLTLAPSNVAQVVPRSSASEPLRVRVAKSALGDLADPAQCQDLEVIAAAVTSVFDTNFRDTIRPIHVRNPLDREDFTLSLDGGRSLQLNVYQDNETQANTGREYATLISTLLPEVERFHGFLFGDTSNLSFFMTKAEFHGFSGLNSTDRGVLSTLGDPNSELEKAQLVAHELSHFHNALDSKLAARWLQEGASEWVAERLMYKHFPRRAVWNYINSLRFKGYFAAVAKVGEDHLPLGEWDASPSDLGYSKSLMFLDLLDAEVGSEALIKALQYALNTNLDTKGFQAFLEHESGRSLEETFSFWVHAGDAASGKAPEDLFQDKMGKGLLPIDNQVFGTNATAFDSDGDGTPDDEEVFTNRNAVVAELTVVQELSNSDQPFTVAHKERTGLGEPLRVAVKAGTQVYYSLDSSLSTISSTVSPTILKGPFVLPPPFSIVASTTAKPNGTSLVEIKKPLYVNGVEVEPAFVQVGILPPAPKSSASYPTTPQVILPADLALTETESIADATNEIPERLGAYDISSWDIEETSPEDSPDGSEAGYNLTIRTRSAPDRFGSWGQYYIGFYAIHTDETNGSGVVATQTATVSAGNIFLTSTTNGVTSSNRLSVSEHVGFGEDLKIKFTAKELANWLDSISEGRVCVWTVAEISGSSDSIKDWGGCINTHSAGRGHYQGQASGFFGAGVSTLDLVVDQGTGISSAAASDFVRLGLESIRQFEEIMGRPFLERSQWQITIIPNTSGPNAVSEMTDALGGSFLSFGAAISMTTKKHLIVDSLARAYLHSLLTRQLGSPPAWIQELMVQWLTETTMYRLLPTGDVHAEFSSVSQQLKCYLQHSNSCLNYFSKDLPLDDWVQEGGTGVASTGAAKTQVFAQVLDAIMGPEAFGKMMQRFAIVLPTTAAIKRYALMFSNPSKSSAIHAAFNGWVVGSDASQIIQALGDSDGDGLFLFEETRLGFSDSVANSYLN